MTKAAFTDAHVQVRLSIGSCGGEATFFLEPDELTPLPPAMAWGLGGYDDDQRRSWALGGLDAKGRLDPGLWSVTQSCAQGQP